MLALLILSPLLTQPTQAGTRLVKMHSFTGGDAVSYTDDLTVGDCAATIFVAQDGEHPHRLGIVRTG